FIAARDLTEIKRYEGELQQKNTELEYASRMKSEFLANMSHELRTPLNAIIGFSEVLRDGLVGPLSESQRTFLADIFSSGNHLLSLINDILDLSKVEAGKMTLELEDIDLASLCGNSLSIIREKAASRNVQLTMDAMSECAVLRADARKVKQIVYNLLANAVKFTERGHVALRVETVPRARVGELLGAWPGRALPLAFNEFNEFIKISVTDSGIGISPTGMAGLFKPFSQIDSGLSREFAGTGLGLALVKLMVELHGGTVAVQSQVNEGACFSVWLPLRAPQLQADGTALAGMAPTRAVEPPTALVIEADAQARELIRLQLEAEGFAVVHAASGPAAVSLAQAQKVALITLDINLPTMDGWELLTELKQIPNLAQIPVVVISLDAEHSRGVALGAAAVLQKPLSRVALQDALVAIGMFPRALALRVLVVDDDPASMELIAHRITALGGTVLRATGGLVAIEMATREAPDLIVLDLMMPDINGFEVVEALRQRNRTVRIPILVITAKDVAKEDRARLRGAVITIMEKSNFGVAMFVTEVRRAIAGRHLVP
ncbi:MAG TPA: response regulator, partial [Kofleriaceae bacterium]|nr:response regulator [Kofleriaceae bacterium]